MENKQILLIGDSIRMGYCATVKEALADVAEVLYPAENCRSTHFVIESLDYWVNLCRAEDVAAVHFNCGHWDAAHFGDDDTPLTTVETYGFNIRKIVRRLKKYFPNAKIYYATTCPMTPDPAPERNRTTDEIRAYNAEGIRAAEDCGIDVDDLFALTIEWDASMFADSCHFTAEGSRILGQTVADFIRERL